MFSGSTQNGVNRLWGDCVMPLIKKPFKEMLNEKDSTAIDEQVSIVLTRVCPIQCEHCYSNCGPNAPKGDKDKIISRVIDICNNEKVKTILLTGGEPFTDFELLLEVISILKEYNKDIILYTNAYWAKSIDIVREKLSHLKDVTLINTSVDKYHQEFIPLENVINLVRGAQETGEFYNGVVITTEPGDDSLEKLVKEKLSEFSQDYVELFVHELCISGRAKDVASDYDDYMVCDYPKGVCTMMSSVIDESGNLFGCCTILEKFNYINPFCHGNVDEEGFNTVYERFHNNIVALALRVLGPSRLAKILIDSNRADKIKDKKYLESDMCAFCIDLFSDPDNYIFLEKYLSKGIWPEKLKLMERIIYKEGEMLAKHKTSS